MTYSRKRYWLALGTVLIVQVAFLVLNPWLQPAPVVRWVMAMGGVAICGVMAFLAFFSLDEIQRQNHMRAWYFGGPLAILFVVMPFVMVVPNPMLEAIADILPNASRLHSPKTYFALGIAVTCLAQLIGNYVARAILAGRTADE